jgi:hypothetical protein
MLTPAIRATCASPQKNQDVGCFALSQGRAV